jgi:hypothetical protein
VAVLLTKGYAGYAAGTVVNLPTSLENTLIAQGWGTASTVALTTTGDVTANVLTGICAIPAGSSSITIKNNLVDASTPISASVCQAAADGTLLRVERVVSAAGSFTIYGTANATATTLIKWAVTNPSGLTETN